jgi:hypothetical protein
VYRSPGCYILYSLKMIRNMTHSSSKFLTYGTNLLKCYLESTSGIIWFIYAKVQIIGVFTPKYHVSYNHTSILTLKVQVYSSYKYSKLVCTLLGRGLCRRGNSPTGWQNAPALNPKMRRDLSFRLLRDVGINTKTRKSLEWFGPPERNTLLHCVLYCLRA